MGRCAMLLRVPSKNRNPQMGTAKACGTLPFSMLSRCPSQRWLCGKDPRKHGTPFFLFPTLIRISAANAAPGEPLLPMLDFHCLHAAVRHGDDAVAEFEDPAVVCDDNHRSSRLHRDVAEQFHGALAGAGIERRR